MLSSASIAVVGFVTVICFVILIILLKLVLSLGRWDRNPFGSQKEISAVDGDCESIQAASFSTTSESSSSSLLKLPSTAFSRYPIPQPSKHASIVPDSGVIPPSLVPLDNSYGPHSKANPVSSISCKALAYFKAGAPSSPLRAPPLSPSDSTTLIMTTRTSLEEPSKPSYDVFSTRQALALVNVNTFNLETQKFPANRIAQSRYERKANTTAIYVSKTTTSKLNYIVLQEKHASEFAMNETSGYNGGYKNGVQRTAYMRSRSYVANIPKKQSSTADKENMAV